MLNKSKNGIYVIGDEIKFNNDKYPGDKYDKELYIPKGYILPNGEMITREYERFHEDMAKRFIEENYWISYCNDFIKDYKDYMLMRIHALQVMSCGQTKVLYCDDHLNKVITDAIVSYLSYDWKQLIIPNPAASYFDYLRYDLLMNLDSSLVFEGENYEKEINKQNILKRC